MDDDWLEIADDLQFSKKAIPDKTVHKKDKDLIAEKLKKQKMAEEELIFEKPEDERVENKKSDYSVDEIKTAVEKRNTAVPISFDQDGNIDERYRQLKTTGKVDIESEDDEDNIEEEIDESDYDINSLLPPKSLETWCIHQESINTEKLESWYRSTIALTDKRRKSYIECLLINSLQFTLLLCTQNESLSPLEEYIDTLAPIIALNNPVFVEFLAQKWDELSDNACPMESEELDETSQAYAEIGMILEDDDGRRELNYGDLAVIKLSSNVLSFKRFRDILTTPIWRTLESLLLDMPGEKFKLEIIELFIPHVSNTVRPKCRCSGSKF